jgi:cytochrome c oxidase cbb3-type subunit 2
VGGKYSDQWQRMHLMDPRSVVPQSNMPSYHWLADEKLDADDIQARMRVLRRLGDPYSDADIAAAPAAIEGKTRMDALIAYLQGLGIKNEPQPPAEGKQAVGTAAGAP